MLADTVLRRTYIKTGPTFGIGRAMAFELAKRGTVILVGLFTLRG
jgi:NAD(P)-dependent dehydrogenase (short-subunit alcohol dehydrogenase family)